MLWQDWVLSASLLILLIALIPTVTGKDKPALATSIITGSLLMIVAFVYVTLSLWFSAIVVTLTGVLWLTLFVQKNLQNKKLKIPKK